MTSSTIQNYLRHAAAAGRERHRAGPFDVFVVPSNDHPYGNYAIPHDGARPTPADVGALLSTFRSAHRTPRLEFLPSAAPDAPEALLAAGFDVENDLPLMTCAPGDVADVPLPAGIELVALEPDSSRDEVRGLVAAQSAAFGESFTEADVDRSAARLGGEILVAARAGAQTVGAGQCLPIHDGITEIAGMAVLESHRGRGIAGALTAELARRAFAAGAHTALLTPGDDAAGRVYARAGFRVTERMLHLRAP